jgi:outer membrane protein TolC
MKWRILPAIFSVGALVLMATTCFAQDKQPYRLTMKDAIQRGLRSNLSVLMAKTRIEEARGTRVRRESPLLPRARAEVPVSLQNRSLSAFGISVPGVPEVVGPFGVYEARLYMDQSLVDLQSYHNLKASEKQEQAVQRSYQDMRNIIVRQIAGLYLNAETAEARVKAAQVRVTTAEALFKLASDQHSAGVATGVDVLRAEVELDNERQGLLQTSNSAKQALLVLARNIGMSLGTPLELAETLGFEPAETPEVEAAVTKALAEREDYQALVMQREALLQQQKANRARYLPKLSLSGNYGAIGRTLGNMRGTGGIEARVSFTIFDRDRSGEQLEIQSHLQQVDDEIDDLRLGIEQQIRDAELTLQSATEEVKVAQAAEGLAERELKLARDRFQAGETNNIEVITAQDSLARAHENAITALTRHADAKIALALALGATEQNYSRYLGIH